MIKCSVKDVCSRNEINKGHLLFLHSWAGCETISSVFCKGKPKLVETLIKRDTWKHLSKLISGPWNNQLEVADASIKAFNLLYGGKGDD